MITSQLHSFLTDLDVPLRTLPEPIQLSPKTVGTFSTWKTLFHLLYTGQDERASYGDPKQGQCHQQTLPEHPQGSQHHAGYQYPYWCCRQQMISRRREWRPREGRSRCQNLEQGQGKEGSHLPVQPGEPVGGGVFRGPKTTQSPSTLGAWRKARRLVILQEYKQTSNCPQSLQSSLTINCRGEGDHLLIITVLIKKKKKTIAPALLWTT